MRQSVILLGLLVFFWTMGCHGATAEPARAGSVSATSLANVAGVKLSWTADASNTRGYLVERSRDGVRFMEVGSVAANVTSYQDTTVFQGVTYTYRVRPIGAEGTVGSAVVKTSDFRVFDCTYFRNKPEPARYGMEKVYITGNGFLWQADKPQGGTDNNTPNERATRNVARTASDRGEILVIDIEHWPVDIRVAKEAEVQSTIRKFIQIIDWVRAERPDVKIGIYGFGPLRDYWTPVSYLGALEKPNDKWQQAHLAEFKQKYQQWQKANDFLKPLMEKVDYVFPSLYTFSNNPPSWVLYAKGNIEEARRYGKPVIPFVWMDYHNSTTLAGQTISGEFWRVQLQTLRQLADGVVIWGGVQFSKDGKSQPRLWNENDPWWVETKAFLTVP